jgi:hypothetical protein
MGGENMICPKCNKEVIDGCCSCTCAGCERLQAEVEEQASGVLKLSGVLRYLNGMVKRGRVSDISDDIEANIKGYIIELETKNQRLRDALKENCSCKYLSNSRLCWCCKALKGGE